MQDLADKLMEEDQKNIVGKTILVKRLSRMGL
jgi:hypothetical protein